MKTSSLRHKIYPVLIILIFRFFLSQCATTTVGDSAAPQASIPLPNAQDPVTVSSPDDSGDVRIIGSAGAVPNSAVVVLKAGVTPTVEESLSRSAPFRVDCTSALPACPSVDADRQCQGTAGDDGSFSILIPATEGEYVLVSYLDPENTCTETMAYTVLVAEGVIRLDYEIQDAILSREETYIYFNALNSDGEAAVVRFDPVTDTASETVLAGIGNANLEMDRFENIIDDSFLALRADAGLYILPIEEDGNVSADQIISVFDEDGLEISNGSYLDTYTVTYTTEGTLGETEIASYQQVFFYSNEQFHVFAFDEDPLDPDWGYDSDGDGDITTSVIDLDFSILEEVYPDMSNITILSMRFVGNEMFLMIRFTAADDSWVVALRRPYDYSVDFRSTTLTFDTTDTEVILLGTAEGGVLIEEVEGFATTDDEENVLGVAVLKDAEKSLTFLDVSSSTGMSCYDSEVLILPGSTITSDTGNDCADPNFNTSEDTLQPDVSGLGDSFSPGDMAVLFDSNDQGEMFMLGNLNSGSGFITEHGTPSVFAPVDPVSVMAPVFMEFISSLNAFVIIDAGVTSDDSSNMIIYELEATPSYY